MFRYLVAKIIKKVRVPAIKESFVNQSAKVCSGSAVLGSSLNKYTYVGNDCSIIYADIGSFCSIADNVAVGGASHPLDRVSTSPVFHSGNNILNVNFCKLSYEPFKKTVIGNDVWIGAGAFLKAGIHVADGAVIGMGAVVTKDVGSYEIWAGNPAKLVKKRFDETTINRLLKSKWWDLSDVELQKIAPSFESPDRFLKDFH